MGGWEVFGVRVYVYNNKIIYCGIAFMRYYNRFFSLLGKTPVHKIGADKRKRKQKCLTHMRNSTTTPPPLTEIRTLLLYYYDLRTWRKHKNLAVFQRSPGHDHTHVSNPPPPGAGKNSRGRRQKKRPVRGEAGCFTRRRAIGVGARERPRVANALGRRAGGSRVRFDDPPSIHPPTPQNKTQPPPLQHYAALKGERRTYGHADCGRRRSGSGEQAVQGAQDRMDYDAHGDGGGGGVYRSTKRNKYQNT